MLYYALWLCILFSFFILVLPIFMLSVERWYKSIHHIIDQCVKGVICLYNWRRGLFDEGGTGGKSSRVSSCPEPDVQTIFHCHGSSWCRFSFECCLTSTSWCIVILSYCWFVKWWNMSTNIYMYKQNFSWICLLIVFFGDGGRGLLPHCNSSQLW